MSYKLLYCAVLLCGIIAIKNYHTQRNSQAQRVNIQTHRVNSQTHRVNSQTHRLNSQTHRLNSQTHRVNRFNDYLRKFSKSYSDTEFQKRMLIFEESLKEIEYLNSKSHGTGASHGLTKFSDLTAAERPSNPMVGGDCATVINKSCDHHIPLKSLTKVVTKLPVGGKLDWRDDNVIGPVLDQKLCNGCWAFSVVGVMESMAAIQGFGFTRLSIQELLDCPGDTTKHCSGGTIRAALDILCEGDFKITTEEKYPLLLLNRTCQGYPSSGRMVSTFSVHCKVSDEYIKELLSHGPVMAVINPTSLYNYIEGIITMNCQAVPYKDFFHVVQIVGYASTTDDDGDEVEYFIIRNSWGTDWGEDGYLRIAMGEDLCGINDHLASLYVS